jgi:hypothetical protein
MRQTERANKRKAVVAGDFLEEHGAFWTIANPATLEAMSARLGWH